ncbi:MAG: HlyC/CorC family transporter [Deltaproteobacteria bacterium]|nr:HlyC/CorC family transporter [Deltaproteobacteria bacterium]
MELFILLLLTLLNGFFSLSELALLSARRPRLQQAAEAGSKGARTALGLLDNQSRLLSTVQVGVTFAGTIAGAYGGATLAEEHVEPWIAGIEPLAPYAPGIALTLVILLVSYLSLVLGELVPKRLALRRPEALAMFVAGPMRVMAAIFRPVVWFLTASTEGLMRLFGLKDGGGTQISDEEIHLMVREGQQAGVFEASEAKMVKGALGLDDRDLASLMTPRPDVVWIDLSAPLEQIKEVLARGGHDRYPVADGTLDNPLGVVYVRDFLDVPLTLEALRERVRQPMVVPVLVSGLVLLERFREESTHFALVVDEYGAMLGIVTLHDILEALIGELPSDGSPPDSWVTHQEDGAMLIDGALPIGDLKGLLDVPTLPHEREYRTAGGLIVRELHRIPKRGDHVVIAGWRLEVTDMDRNRVDAIRIVKEVSLPSEATPEAEAAARARQSGVRVASTTGTGEAPPSGQRE